MECTVVDKTTSKAVTAAKLEIARLYSLSEGNYLPVESVQQQQEIERHGEQRWWCCGCRSGGDALDTIGCFKVSVISGRLC